MRRYWYWPGWKGGNTKNRVGKGDKVLILGDYLGPQEVGEGEIRDWCRSRRGVTGTGRVGKGKLRRTKLGDYLGSQKVGEGGELCLFH